MPLSRPIAVLVGVLIPFLVSPVQTVCAAEPQFNTAQRAEIVEILRQALRSDPSILRDAIAALQNQDGAERQASAQTAIAAHRAEIFTDPQDAGIGNPHGDVTLVEFYDPRCPYCRRMLPVIAAVVKNDPGLRVVYKDLPILGPASQVESRALLAAARQGGYARLQQAIMQGQQAGTEDAIRAAASASGLDPRRLEADMNDPAIQTQLAGNIRLAQELGIEGTPAFLLAGPAVQGHETFVSGAMSEAELRQAIAAARH